STRPGFSSPLAPCRINFIVGVSVLLEAQLEVREHGRDRSGVQAAPRDDIHRTDKGRTLVP
ncbi:MAG: hypothetical protein ABN488_00505, partial [Methylobacteriaceae bacterium]